MDLLVKNSMQVEITGNNIAKGFVTKYTVVRLPLVNEVAHCVIKGNNEIGIHMVLQCPRVCVQNKFLFAVVVKLGRMALLNDNFKRINSCSTIVLLSQLTLDDLNDMYNEIKNESTNKLYFEVLLTIKSEQVTPRQRFFKDITSPELADFTFEVGDTRFKAHKFILSARSPVFARMLSNNGYKETQQAVMRVTDTTECAFKIFLDFIYKAEVPNLSVFGAVELIKLSEKYDFGDLKSICEIALIKKLTQRDCVYDIFMFAHRYNCSQELINKAFEFIQRKYFIGKVLPANLCSNPNEVQRLVTKMNEFDETLQAVHDDLNNPTKKLKRN